MIINKFQGINNTFEPTKLPLGQLIVANNVMIAKDDSVKRRPGHILRALGTDITASYCTSDNAMMFIVDNGTLYSFDGASVTALVSGLSSAPTYWCEESVNRVFCINRGIYIQIDNLSVPTDLNTLPVANIAFNVEKAPSLGVIAMTFYSGSVVLAVQLEVALTEIRFSVPQHYHLFYQVDNRFQIPDVVVGMESVNGQLLICCLHGIYTYTSDNRLLKLSDYGCVPGKPITKLPANGCLIWTTRGVVTYPEFTNNTESEVSLAPGNGAATSLFEQDGDIYLLICNDGGGLPYNAA